MVEGGLIFIACLAIPFAVFGCVHLLARFEARNEALGDGACGDWPAVPDDLKSVFHNRESAS